MPDADTLDTLALPPAPALSATSDVPTATPVDTPPNPDQSDSTATEAGEADSPPQAKAEETGERDKTSPQTKAAISRAKNQAKAAEARAQQLETQLQQALAGIEKLTAKPEERRPQRDQFNSPDEYDRALETYAANRATEKAKAEAKQEAQQTAQARQFEATREAYKDRAEAFAETHDDYFDVVDSDDAGFTLPMTAAILESEDGPLVAYHLATHPADMERIKGLSPARTVFEIGKLAAKLTAPPPPKPTPIRPLGNRNAAASDEEPSMEAYAEKRMKELRAQRN